MKFSELFDLGVREDDDWFDPFLSLDTLLFMDPSLITPETRSRRSRISSCSHGHKARSPETKSPTVELPSPAGASSEPVS